MATGRFPTQARQRADGLVARALPLASLLAASLASLLPLPLPGAVAPGPALPLMVAYYWTIHRPDLLPAPALFAIGMGQDVLAGGPPGLTALTLLLCRQGVLAARRRLLDRPAAAWCGFAVTAGAALALAWGVNSLFDLSLIEVRGALRRAVLAVSLFPVLALGLGRARRALFGAG